MPTAPTPRKPAVAAKRAASSHLRGSNPTGTLGQLLTRKVSRLTSAGAIIATLGLVAACNGMFSKPDKAEAAPAAKTAPQNTPS